MRAVGTLDGGAANALQVAACGRLAHGNRTDHLAAGKERQILFLLLLGTVVQDVGGHNFVVQTKADAACACAGDSLHLQHGIEFVCARAAIFLGQCHTQKTVLAGLVPHGTIHVALLFPGLVVRRDFLGDEALEALTKRAVIFVEQGAVNHGVPDVLFKKANAF